jgi:hypothetical protein
MNRRHTLGLLAALSVSLLAPATALASAPGTPRTLRFEAEHEGVTTRLELQVQGEAVEGTLQEPGLSLAVRGNLQGTRLEAALREPLTGLRLARLQGTLRGNTLALEVTPRGGGEARSLVMQRPGSAPRATADGVPGGLPATAAGTTPGAFAGRWRHQQNVNSAGGAGGFAGFSTETAMHLGADGRIRQWSRAAGGGAGWSAVAQDRPEFSGRWQVRGEELWVQAEGRTPWRRVGRIRRSGEYLVTEGDGGRRIWQR